MKLWNTRLIIQKEVGKKQDLCETTLDVILKILYIFDHIRIRYSNIIISLKGSWTENSNFSWSFDI